MAWFIDNSETYKANAKRRRDVSTGSTVRMFATSSAMYAARRGGNVGPGTWEHCLADVRARWECARGEAIAEFRYQCNGDEMEGFL